MLRFIGDNAGHYHDAARKLQRSAVESDYRLDVASALWQAGDSGNGIVCRNGRNVRNEHQTRMAN